MMPGHDGRAIQESRRRARIAELRDRIERLFPRPTVLMLEIGCGHGHFLADYAEKHPHEACLGIDLISQRVGRTLRKAKRADLDNLFVLKAEAEEFIAALPVHVRLGRTFLIHPDPWPKRRHHKNRLLKSSFLDQLARCSREGAPLHFRTDHPGYFRWGREHLGTHPWWELRPEMAWPFEAPSYFQELLPQSRSVTAIRRATPRRP